MAYTAFFGVPGIYYVYTGIYLVYTFAIPYIPYPHRFTIINTPVTN